MLVIPKGFSIYFFIFNIFLLFFHTQSTKTKTETCRLVSSLAPDNDNRQQSWIPLGDTRIEILVHTTMARIFQQLRKILLLAVILVILVNLAVCLNINDDLSKSSSQNQVIREWLDSNNAANAAIEVLPSGLLVQRMREGPGKFHPALDTYCEIDMEVARLTLEKNKNTTSGIAATSNAIIQEASDKSQIVRPNDFVNNNQNMPGAAAVREALPRMVAGDWWDLYVEDHDINDIDNMTQTTTVLVVSLEVIAVSDQGYNIPKGEYHNCRVTIRDVLEDTPGHLARHPFEGGAGCEERDYKYIQKIATAQWHDDPRKRSTLQNLNVEIARLKRMLSKTNMKPSLAVWVRRRVDILQQFMQQDLRLCHLHFGPTPGLLYVYKYQTDCSAQEQEYLWHVLPWSHTALKAETLRLRQMLLGDGQMEATLASWVRRRLWILMQIGRAVSIPETVAGTETLEMQAHCDAGDATSAHETKDKLQTQITHNGDEL